MDVHSKAAVVDDFLPSETMEGGDGVSLEWLSMFVEDCLNGGGFSTQPLPPPTTTQQTTPTNSQQQSPTTRLSPQTPKGPTPSIPCKATRTKRRKLNNGNINIINSHQSYNFHDCPLLPQSQWLADSQLIFPKKDEGQTTPVPVPVTVPEVEEEEEEVKGNVCVEEGQGPRRCSHCGSYKTPQWRAGPLGPKTLCNACGVRFKSGRLLPEYRPAKSPTFESFKHSNSHKKVLEMRMMATSILSSNTN